MSPTRQPTSKDGASVARPTWYLALGDFLSVGFHPGRGRTEHGYDDVLRRFRKDLFPDLRLRNVGCPGETTRALITGERSLCSYPAESQLDAAVDFLTAHPGQVAFINDRRRRERPREPVPGAERPDPQVVRDGPGAPAGEPRHADRGCVVVGRKPGRADRRHDLPQPVPGSVGTGARRPCPRTRRSARVGGVQRGARGRVRRCRRGDRGRGEEVPIADFEHTVVVPGRGRIPVNVALACRWTWFCTSRFFTDPHPNRKGYRRIAHTFERELRPVLEP